MSDPDIRNKLSIQAKGEGEVLVTFQYALPMNVATIIIKLLDPATRGDILSHLEEDDEDVQEAKILPFLRTVPKDEDSDPT